ncbi:MAG: hypothetical protein QGH42_10420 [Kiritimatiellia bacterium]|nr:hypothetical protein [Kiritimatiellia bacterium]MDP7024636.1 hypothetical protein [Kiritimatiellia bacterium]
MSAWLSRFARDGFDGVELWEFHFLPAEKAEQERLVTAASSVAIYNSYVGFADEEAEARAAAAEAITRLQPRGVKYNLGGDASKRDEYRRNLLAWADALPADCRLLCECHGGTILEQAEDAAAFFADLDPARFGVVVHVSGDAAGTEKWFSELNGRVQHLHVQMRGPESDPSVAANRPALDAGFAVVKAHGYTGSVAIEFSRGIGRDEDIEEIYTNACTDLAYVRQV